MIDRRENYLTRADEAPRILADLRARMIAQPRSRSELEMRYDRIFAEMRFNTAVAEGWSEDPRDVLRRLNLFVANIQTGSPSGAYMEQRFIRCLEALLARFERSIDSDADDPDL